MLNKMLGAATKVTNANQTVHETAYNADGTVKNEYIPSTVSLNYTYTNGRLSNVLRGGWLPGESGADNKQDQNYVLTYDELGRLEEVAVESNVLVTNTYDELSCLTEQEYGNGDTTTYTYDDLGRVKKMVQDDGTVTTYYYSTDGKLSRMESGGMTYRYVYDSLGRMVFSDMGTATSTSLQTRHEYDTSGRLKKQVLNLVDKTYSESYTYDSYGRLSSMVAGDGKSIALAYDSLSRVSTVTKTAAKATYTYLAGSGTDVSTGLVSKLAYTANGNSFSAVSYAYEYDALGNITSYTDSSDSTNSRTYTYDAQGQLLREYNGGSIVGVYTYDTYGNIRTYSNGVDLIHYSYDDSEWKDLLTAYDGETITYDAIGNPTSYYNGTRWSFGWENGRQLATATTSKGDTNTTIDYAYDMNGYRTSKTIVTKTYETVLVHNYVTTVVAPTCTEGGYTLHECACGESYQSDETAALGHSYVESGTDTYTCTRCGDTYSDHTHNYTTTVVEPTCTEDGYTLYTCACGYSYQDDVVSKLGHDYTKVSQIGSYVTYECSRCVDTYTTRVIIIDPPTPPIIEYGLEEEAAVMTASSTGCSSERVLKATVTEEHSYIYASGKLLRETITTTAADGTVTTEVLDFCYDAQGVPYSLTRTKGTSSSETYYYITNLQGDVTRLVTSTGATAVTYSYDAYGRTDINYTSSTYAALATSNPLRYRGYYYDTETGFYYVSSRYYDPSIGRFINADDPSYLAANGDFISYNLFAYCGNNPVVRADNGGQFWNVVIGATAGAAISALVTGVTSYRATRSVNWASVAVSAVGGAVSGAFAATGIGVNGQMIANAVIGGVSSLADTYLNSTEETNLGNYIANAVTGTLIGVVAGKVGGNGTGNRHLSHSAGRFINKVWDAATNILDTGFAAAWNQTKKAAAYYYSQVATESVKRGVQAIVPIATSNLPNLLYQLS